MVYDDEESIIMYSVAITKVAILKLNDLLLSSRIQVERGEVEVFQNHTEYKYVHENRILWS